MVERGLQCLSVVASAAVDDTTDRSYTERLERLESAPWKRWLNVQAPYRWNLRRLQPGLMLDVGCGIGRNLLHVDGNGIGVDHNEASVRVCRERGLRAYAPEEFATLDPRPSFDSLLFAHVVEHMPFDAACALVREYLPFLREGGRVLFITPQEAGFRSDETHVEFVDFDRLRQLCREVDVTVTRAYSFPFPRSVGRVFPYNEFVVVGNLNTNFQEKAMPRHRR